MELTPYSPGCGVVVGDVQLADLSDADLDQLRAAFGEHGLLFFRDQDLSPGDHLAFARRYGDIVLNKFFTHTDTHPEIAEVRKEPGQEMNIGGDWHTDHSYDEAPALGSILVARELPASGGNTKFANLNHAFEALSPGFQTMLESLRAVHSNRHIYGEGGFYRTTDLSEQLGGVDRVGDATHPVVIRHPDSGRKVLYVNPAHTIGIEGWNAAESRALLRFLYKHVDQSEFTCDFEWEPGSVAFWDNRSTWHNAANDYAGERRLMHRITLAGSALSGV
ncbi:MAG: TauD/TfdA dioxygenase family protein [Ilumatobacteraceae bacterium]